MWSPLKRHSQRPLATSTTSITPGSPSPAVMTLAISLPSGE
jgi:hypothetical protein